ncbi:MAG TPA: NYN domain-containing protein [Candidatus Saccharimonadales bacterium]|nr:NYN domain-containing protein [Candidatus Saccharimonadales bacterium]
MRTILYIDGFNLFYSAVKGTPLRWLNPVALIERAFARNQIIATKYFTAKVSALPGNPGQPIRQMILWRALRTLLNLEIIEGDFRTREVMAAVVSPPPNFMRVFKTEEKGSDVNLAAHLLLDGFRNKYECAIVMSGDSDLVTPIRMVRDELKKPVGILNPQRLSGPNCRPPRKNAGLQHAASFYQNGVTWAQLQAAQFPPTMTDVTAAFHKPPTW